MKARILCNLLLCCIPLLLIPTTATAQPSPAAVSESLRYRIEQLRAGEELKPDGGIIASRIVLPALYERRNYRPLWSNPDSVEQLLEAIRNIDRDGLNPEDYHLQTIVALAPKTAAATAADPERTADLDLLLTDSLIRLGYHLSFGKVDPEALDPDWNMRRYINDLDQVLALVDYIERGEVGILIESFRPRAEIYDELRTALAGYRRIQSEGGWNRVADGPALKPEMTDPRVVALRARLVVTGDMPARDMDSPQFDASVETAVTQFQNRHGLTADGVVGKATLAAMNVPVAARIDQIRANLERARWVLHDLPDTFVLADIAGFRLSYFREGQPLWETRAQVGKPFRKTPVFRSQITYMDLNPTWTVPPTILRQDVLPAIKRDPNYLSKKNMRVLDRNGKTVDSASIDWSKYPRAGFPYIIRQDPGPSNALGRIKFMFPNKHMVYLHDTPSKSLFARAERAFSSGCIRIENPYDFAELLLENGPAWSRDKIIAAIDSLRTQTIRLDKPVTVILLYWTVDVDTGGRVIFKQDIYDRDPPIIRGLAQDFSFRERPVIKDKP